MHTRADQLLSQLLIEHFDTLPTQCRHIEHMHEGVWFPKKYYWQNSSYENFDIFQSCFNKKGLCMFCDSAYTGRSTPTTAFDGAIWHFVYTMLAHWTYAWRSLVHKNLLLTKWQLWELGQFLRIVLNRGYSSTCAMIVHTQADQLLSQLLLDSLDTLLSHYRHIGNLHEEVRC